MIFLLKSVEKWITFLPRQNSTIYWQKLAYSQQNLCTLVVIKMLINPLKLLLTKKYGCITFFMTAGIIKIKTGEIIIKKL